MTLENLNSQIEKPSRLQILQDAYDAIYNLTNELPEGTENEFGPSLEDIIYYIKEHWKDLPEKLKNNLIENFPEENFKN